MSNKLHTDWLREGVRKWNYRRKKVSFQPNLSGIRFFDFLPRDFRDKPKTSRFFEGIDLSDADLSNADLSDLNFSKADFSNSLLTEADMSMSNFNGANFTNANLYGANARLSYFNGSYFESAGLANIDFEGVSIVGAIFVATRTQEIRNASAEIEHASTYASIEAYRSYLAELHTDQASAQLLPKTVTSSETDDERTKKNLYDVFFATNRNPVIERDELVGFGSENTEELHYGVTEVLIPDGHRIGSIGSPLWKRLLNRKDDRLRLENLIALSDELFWKLVRDTAAKMKKQADPTLFVHGFNTSFEDAVLRAAQIGYDLGIGQGIGLFSWPSKGNFLKYVADETSAENSKYLLAEFIRDFGRNSPTGRLNVIAHSMGCRCLVGALEQLALSDKSALTRINQVILAAADVDNKIMPHQCRPAVGNCNRVTSYVSDLDQALTFSGWLHSFPRVGITPPTFVLEGVDTIVVNDLNLGDFKHGYVSSSRTILSDMFSLLKHGLSPNERHSMEAISDNYGNYWRIKE
ncbi:alpha/beta hydrolase [Roseovarius mucosus]|uniref:alpha/beta hydrolase n=1 Tax=Roseovarius mucosus TaxID=215743 RepID=UPI003BABF6BC